MDPPIASIKPLDIPTLLHEHGLRPVKGLGQNFLTDEDALVRILNAANITSADQVLEIGAGLGSLTRHLANVAKRVVAVELDKKLIRVLKSVLAPFPNIELVQADILTLDLAAHFSAPGYLVVANIPYYITSALIRRLLESPVPPARLILTLQKEVAQRITAQPGKMSLLALSVQVYGQPEIVCGIPARAFYPEPKIASAVVHVDLYPQPRIPADQLDTFFRLAKAGFSQKRKTLANSLSAGLSLPKSAVEKLLHSVDIDAKRRAQTLSLDEWELLTKRYLQES